MASVMAMASGGLRRSEILQPAWFKGRVVALLEMPVGSVLSLCFQPLPDTVSGAYLIAAALFRARRLSGARSAWPRCAVLQRRVAPPSVSVE